MKHYASIVHGERIRCIFLMGGEWWWKMLVDDVRISGDGHEGVVLSCVLSELGYFEGANLTIDRRVARLALLRDGDVVVLRSKVGGKNLYLLRQFVRPFLLITNSKSANLANVLDDYEQGVEIVGRATLARHSSNVVWYG